MRDKDRVQAHDGYPERPHNGQYVDAIRLSPNLRHIPFIARKIHEDEPASPRGHRLLGLT